MDNDTLGILVPILAVGLSLSIPIIGIISDYRKRRQLIEANHAERMAAIERGIELPPVPDDILSSKPKHGRRSTLLPGLIWLFIGLAILGTIFTGSVSFTSRGNLLLCGLVPTAVGLALLIYHAVEGKKVHAAAMEADKNRALRPS